MFQINMLLTFSMGDDCPCPTDIQEELFDFHNQLQLHCGEFGIFNDSLSQSQIDCLLTAFYKSSRNWKLKFEGLSSRLFLQPENIGSCSFFVPVWHLSLRFRVVVAEFQFSASHFALTF